MFFADAVFWSSRTRSLRIESTVFWSSRTRSLRIESQREHASNILLYFVHVPSSGTEIKFQREHATSNLLVWSVKFGSRGRSKIELDTAPIRQVWFQREIPT